MASNFEIKVEGYLSEYLKPFNLPYETESDAGNRARYDFLIPTEPPIVIEADGIQHRKPNDFFFKSVEAFQHYKNNDKYKDMQSNMGKIHLIRLEDEKITYEEFVELLEPFKEVLNNGVNENYAEKSKKDEERANKRRTFEEALKEKNKAYRQKQNKRAREKNRIYQEEQKANKKNGKGYKGPKNPYRDIFMS